MLPLAIHGIAMRSTGFENCRRKIDDADIDAAAKEWGQWLPVAFRSHYRERRR